jgi:low temperature requirement protein LtrA
VRQDNGVTEMGLAERIGPVGDERRVSMNELFFDLVFVFAFTQVSSMLAADTTWSGLGRAVLVFLLLWWVWDAYSWLTNTVPADQVGPRLALLASMATMLLVALAVPAAFDRGRFIFGAGLLVAMLLHFVLYKHAAEAGRVSSRALVVLGAGSILSGLLLVVGSFTNGAAQVTIWLIALVVAYSWPHVIGVGGFTVRAAHFVERHGLIVIVALGESVVAIGVGAGPVAPDAATAGTALLAILLVGGLWWCYFDVEAGQGERVLAGVHGAARVRLARDVYSYLYIPLVLGVVVAAVGIKKALGHPGDPLSVVVASAFGLGVAMYFLALAAIRARQAAAPGIARLAAAAGALASIAVGVSVAAWVVLAVGGVLVVAVVVAERVGRRREDKRGGAGQVRVRGCG